MAIDDGLDLIKFLQNAEPPFVKIMNLGKYKYESTKKKNEAKKKQKIISIKELKFRPAIEEHDFEVKLKAARKFLSEGDKVKITMRFRGRELANPEIAMEVLNRLKTETEDIAKAEVEPKMEGR
jgi:translation initiation factor IF-3